MKKLLVAVFVGMAFCSCNFGVAPWDRYRSPEFKEKRQKCGASNGYGTNLRNRW